MTAATQTNGDDAGLPGLHQGHAGGDLGRDHQARVDRAVRLRRRRRVRPAARRRLPRPRRARRWRRPARPRSCVDGEVIEADPPRRLVQTWRMLMDPRSGGRGLHAPHLRDRAEASRRRHAADRHPRARGRAEARRAGRGRERGRRAPAAAGPGCSATSSRCWRPARRSPAERASRMRAPRRLTGRSRRGQTAPMDLTLIPLDEPTETRTFDRGRFELYHVGPDDARARDLPAGLALVRARRRGRPGRLPARSSTSASSSAAGPSRRWTTAPSG